MKKMRFFTLLICLVILLCSCSEKSTVERKKWEGAEVRGTVCVDKDCPVLLERGTVTFDLPEFPYLGTDSAEKFLAYPGRVTTEYHFYNPTDEAVTVKLAFPVYGRAAYSAIEDGDPVSDLHKYSITLNGKTVTPELRHSMHESYRTWTRLDVEYSSIMDELAAYHFYYPEAPVTVSTYTVGGIDVEAYPDAFAVLDIPQPAIGIGSLFIPGEYKYMTKEECLKGLDAENGMTITVYDIGVETDELPEWKIYSTKFKNEAELIAGAVTLTEKKTITFYDLAMTEWSAESGIKEVDWYNAFVREFTSLNGQMTLDISDMLKPWYRYEITLAPGEHAVNTVTSPIYPIANTKYSPAIYTYEYSCDAMTTAEGFAGIEVVVNTPYCLIREDLGGMFMYETGWVQARDYESTDGGYRYLIETTRYGRQIVFTLSESDAPERNSEAGEFLVYLFLSLLVDYVVYPIAIIALIIVAVIVIVKVVRKRRAKKEDGDGQDDHN